jgi:hypothetical protein
MKSYFSIPGIRSEFKIHEGKPCTAFYKYDGSCLRFEWSKKKGWYKFGTRNRLFDETDAEYGQAIKLFNETYANNIEKVFQDDKNFKTTNRSIVYCEFFAPSSFAGWHKFDEKFELRLFDVNIHNKGLLLPSEFLRSFGHLQIATTIYQGRLTKNFVEQVINNELECDLNEGVVIKGGESQHKLWMVKVKTRKWLQELKTKAEKFQSFNQILNENQKEQLFF